MKLLLVTREEFGLCFTRLLCNGQLFRKAAQGPRTWPAIGHPGLGGDRESGILLWVPDSSSLVDDWKNKI